MNPLTEFWLQIALAAITAIGFVVVAWALLRRKSLFPDEESSHIRHQKLFCLDARDRWQTDSTGQSWLHENGTSDPAAALSNMYPDRAGEIRAKNADLTREGTVFSLLIADGPDQVTEIYGELQGAMAVLRVEEGLQRDCSALAVRQDAGAAQNELTVLKQALSEAPFVLARSQDDYRDVLSLPTKATPAMLPEELTPGRLQLHGSENWFEIIRYEQPDGDTLIYGYPCDELVAHEQLFNGLLSTLSQSFARLPIGIILFGAERRPVLFNPAVADLLGLDPAWLALSPDLRLMLEKLQQSQVIVNEKGMNSVAFIRKIEEDARKGGFADDWVLPDGRLLQVAAWAAGDDALAFLVHDVSEMIELQRQRQADLMLNQSVLDAMPDAVAVFDAAGMLTVSNEAFDQLLGDVQTGIDMTRIENFCSLMKARSQPSRFWQEVIRVHRQRSTGLAPDAMVYLDGLGWQAKARPLPNEAVLVAFRSAGGTAVASNPGNEAVA